jgi:hypothetical protein
MEPHERPLPLSPRRPGPGVARIVWRYSPRARPSEEVTMASSFPSLVGSTFADIASAMTFGASNLAGTSIAEAIERMMRGRAEEARSIFLEELGQGLRPPRDPGEVDEFVAILYRYLSKAREGAARLNLRLMARVVRGQLEGRGLYASEFLRYSELLASLTREEVILLATRHRLRLEFDAAKTTADWSDTSIVNKRVESTLVPNVFPTPVHLNATLTALQRTGLVWPAAATSGGGPVWQDTPLLDQVALLARFEGALESEGQETRKP